MHIGALLAEILTDMGYVCTVEDTEAGAVAAAVRRRPHLMIVDVRLGEGSGIAAVEEILHSGPAPHVFITGDTSRVHKYRPDAVLVQKPFHMPDLILAIQRVLVAGASA